MNQKVRGRNAFRAIYFAPYVLGVAVVAVMWRFLLDNNIGMVNYYLGELGLPDDIAWDHVGPGGVVRPRRCHGLVDAGLQRRHLPRRAPGHPEGAPRPPRSTGPTPGSASAT